MEHIMMNRTFEITEKHWHQSDFPVHFV